MSIVQLLRQRAELRRADCAVDAAGDTVRSWRTVARRVPCVFEHIDDQLRAEGGGDVTVRRGRFFLDAADGQNEPAGDDDPRPRPGDRLRLDNRDWAVLSVRVETGARAAVRVAEVARADN